MISHLSNRIITIILVEMNNCDIIGILPNLCDLVLKVEISQLSDIGTLEVVDWLGEGCNR